MRLTGSVGCFGRDGGARAAKVERSSRLAELMDLKASMVTLGMLKGKHWQGRKPKAV